MNDRIPMSKGRKCDYRTSVSFEPANGESFVFLYVYSCGLPIPPNCALCICSPCTTPSLLSCFSIIDWTVPSDMQAGAVRAVSVNRRIDRSTSRQSDRLADRGDVGRSTWNYTSQRPVTAGCFVNQSILRARRISYLLAPRFVWVSFLARSTLSRIENLSGTFSCPPFSRSSSNLLPIVRDKKLCSPSPLSFLFASSFVTFFNVCSRFVSQFYAFRLYLLNFFLFCLLYLSLRYIPRASLFLTRRHIVGQLQKSAPARTRSFLTSFVHSLVFLWRHVFVEFWMKDGGMELKRLRFLWSRADSFIVESKEKTRPKKVNKGVWKKERKKERGNVANTVQ